MNTNMNVTIRRLMNTFVLFFLLVSGVAAYVQISNHAFLNGPDLTPKPDTSFLRTCPPYDQPVRGRILDRNGNVIAQSVRDPNATCGYRREYAPWVASSGLAPLIGYFSYKYGMAGIEAQYDEMLSGTGPYVALNDPTRKILHQPRAGNDITLTIDKNTQILANNVYDGSAIYGNVCQPVGSHPAGSIIVDDPRSGEIIAMVSRPSYDPNRIDDSNYWRQLNSDPQAPLLNHATQSVIPPGSTFKTLTMLAGLDAGTLALDSQYTFDESTNYVVNGEPIRWDDYFSGVWNGILRRSSFPLTLEQGYQYSDNVIFARAAVKVGADTWLDYARRFGVATPGHDSQPVPFDAPYARSSAYPATINGKPTDFSPNLLAESGFGQGRLQISPLTMAEITSAVAADGYLYDPHVVKSYKGSDGIQHDQPSAVPYTGGPVIHPETAQSVRHAMWSVVDHGTAWAGLFRNGAQLRDSPTHEGGKTGTAQLESGNPHAWWISLAPDDQAPGGSAAKYVITVNKERSGEGACQVFVADDIYRSLLHV
ncbi:MAG: penicillin-binding transpeptidase domain-containing protein [Ktedonobacterales bacterium]